MLVVVAAFVACDNRQALRAPEPTLARMLDQRRGDPYAASSAFADGMSMRVPPRGTVPRDGDPAPPVVTRELLTVGRARFERICAACHGAAGDGQSVVATKMTRRPAPSLHDDDARAMSREQIHAIVTHGYGLMPSYSEALGPADRWAVVAYVKALQLSQRAPVPSLPPEVRAELTREAP